MEGSYRTSGLPSIQPSTIVGIDAEELVVLVLEEGAYTCTAAAFISLFQQLNAPRTPS